MDYSFLPFKNKLEELDGSDLERLKEISEGWYIDYKEKSIKIPDYAKHMSAFSNQYGGWLIVGVREKSDGSRTAGEFPGIKNDEVERVSLAIREAGSAHVNPAVYYEEKVISGPIEEINLLEGCSIIVIGIPRSKNTPHIHSSGRIYRRLSDQSKPKEETDRYILDELWRRAESYKKKTIKKLTAVPELPKNQSESTWGHIFFEPKDGQSRPKKRLTFKEFSTIVRDTDKSVYGVRVPLNVVHTVAGGFVARQTTGNDPSLAALTMRWWHDGSVRFDIPISVYSIEGFLNGVHENNHFLDYVDIAEENGYKDMKIVDYSRFYAAIAGLANIYLHLLDVIEDTRDYLSCYTLRNLFHTSPYIDSEKYIDRVKSLSIPLTMERDLVIPSEPGESNMFPHDYEKRKIVKDVPKDKCMERQVRPYLFVAPVVFSVFKNVGVISNTDDFVNDSSLMGYDKVNYQPKN